MVTWKTCIHGSLRRPQSDVPGFVMFLRHFLLKLSSDEEKYITGHVMHPWNSQLSKVHVQYGWKTPKKHSRPWSTTTPWNLTTYQPSWNTWYTYIVYVCVVCLFYYNLTYPKIFEYTVDRTHGTTSLMKTKCLLSSQKCTWKTRLMEHPTAFVTHHDLWKTIQYNLLNTTRFVEHTTPRLREHTTRRLMEHTTTRGTHDTTIYGTHHDLGNIPHHDL